MPFLFNFSIMCIPSVRIWSDDQRTLWLYIFYCPMIFSVSFACHKVCGFINSIIWGFAFLLALYFIFSSFNGRSEWSFHMIDFSVSKEEGNGCKIRMTRCFLSFGMEKSKMKWNEMSVYFANHFNWNPKTKHSLFPHKRNELSFSLDAWTVDFPFNISSYSLILVLILK